MLLLVFAAAAVLLAGCAGAPPRGEAPSAPPALPAGREPAPSAPPFRGGVPSALPRLKVPEIASGRPVRVLLGGAQKEIRIAGESIRAWSAAGAPVAGGEGAVALSVIGEKIRWGAGKLLDSPIDVASPSGMRIDGKPLVARVRVSARGAMLYAVAVVPLEEYVAAVASREAPPSFHPEALSALAVAVRTYALLSMEKPREPTHDVVAGVEDQVFEGLDHVAEVFRKAAAATRGEVLSYRGSLARAVFHSTCGGRTENAKDAWGSDVPYLRSVACDDCLESPARKWEYRMTAKEGKRIALSLGVRAKEDLKISVAVRSSTGRAGKIRISSNGVSREVAAAAFRKEAGYARVKSLKMEIVPVGNGWSIAGEG
ncbi:MAG: SpoIID/LytB domain-containing protein [Deltaproteobacteria bacterium]|nr:SpoIID/LytB domain-containing protein [Deltaproteobacteria bacterium]